MPDNHLRIQTDEKRLVLVVDDESINRDLLGMILSDEYSVIYAENGEEALEQIEKYQETLSLVLLDLLMPVMSGLVVLKKLKENPDLASIPVIVLTADHESEVASLELGAIDFIPKPYPKQNVITARIRRIIELSEDRKIIHSTERDTLTGLYNREFFYNYAESFDHYHRQDPMDAIVMDINHFHIVNERYGKLIADQILCHIGWNLRDMVQESGGIVCRREADTFLIYRPHNNDYEEVLRKAAEGLSEIGDDANKIRLRLGVYQDSDKELNIEQRFDRAKAAADTVRNNYSQNIAVYDNSMHEREMFAEQLTEDFDKAIREKQFKVHYQPKFDISSDTPVLSSSEALVRWQHPKLGMVSPGTFIPLFEENGMIHRLDHYVWEEAAAQIKAWQDKLGLTVPVSVNVSRVDMSEPDITGSFRRILSDHNLDPGYLILEITESAYSEDEDFIVPTVNSLRDMGLKVEMDDFGTGYSSLGMISKLPIDALKMDMIFVRNAFADRGDMKMIELIIDIARYLGVPVIAEGVETKEQVDVLKEMGCDIIQGYYFSKPLPPEEFERFILEKKSMLEGKNTAESLSDQQSPEKDWSSENEALEAAKAGAGSVGKAESTADNSEDFFTLSHNSLSTLMQDEDHQKFRSVFTKENMMQELDKNGQFTVSCRLMLEGKPAWVKVNASRTEEGALADAESENNSLDMDKGLMYSRIVQALARDYYSIYMVNIHTDEFVEYSSTSGQLDLKVERSGKDFFEVYRKKITQIVHPDDLKKALTFLDKSNLEEELDNGKPFSVNCRLLFDDTVVHVNCRVIRMAGEDEGFILIAVSNIDEQVRREQEYEKVLMDARLAALRDPLTGVKSKHAFNEMENNVNERIKSGEMTPFAVAICDINGLKEVNDTKGHKAGDEFLISACRIICNWFKHSPVYRIGGDEFVVILDGEDYQNRDDLIKGFVETNKENQGSGKVVIACGLSQWSGDKGELFEEVFKRADDKMYENKKILKESI